MRKPLSVLAQPKKTSPRRKHRHHGAPFESLEVRRLMTADPLTRLPFEAQGDVIEPLSYFEAAIVREEAPPGSEVGKDPSAFTVLPSVLEDRGGSATPSQGVSAIKFENAKAPAAANLAGVGTASVSYGKPSTNAGGGRCVISFAGQKTLDPKDGEIELGTLTFTNGVTVAGSEMQSIDLTFDFTLGPGGQTRRITIPLEVLTTPNTTGGDPRVVADSVLLKSSAARVLVSDNEGNDYELMNLRFERNKRDTDSSATELVTREGKTNSVRLVGELPGPGVRAQLEGTTLAIYGTNKKDDIVLDSAGANGIRVRAADTSGKLRDVPIFIGAASRMSVEASRVKEVTALLYDGVDRFVAVRADKPLKVFGGDGVDKIYGSDKADRLFGGEGNDELYGFAGDDFLYGNEGADKLFGNQGKDWLDAGAAGESVDGGTGVAAGQVEDDFDAWTWAPGGVRATDIEQAERLGSCAVMASLISVAGNVDLAKRITYLGDSGLGDGGLYQVPLFHNGAWIKIPVNFDGTHTSLDAGVVREGVSWPILYARAYERLNRWYKAGNDGVVVLKGQYVDSHPDRALEALTGRDGSYIRTSRGDLLSEMRSALASRQGVVAGSVTNSDRWIAYLFGGNRYTSDEIVTQHAYAVKDIVVGDKSKPLGAKTIVTLHNPWQLDSESGAVTGGNDGEIRLTWPAFLRSFHGVSIA